MKGLDMARPRKPTELHVVSGSARKHPDRMRERTAEPIPGGFDLRDAPAPDHLDEALAAIWKEVTGLLHARVSSGPDLIALEALVRLVAVMRSGEAAAADYARLQAYLGEFGMTPASRSKVAQAKKPDEPKGFAALKGAG
jgi:phage terminase small subunit